MNFSDQVVAEMPRLLRYARALTRDHDRANDLVQTAVTRALIKQHLWQSGTDLRAWLFTILHNQYVNDVRRAVREGVAVPIDDEISSSFYIEPKQTTVLELNDLEAALNRLPFEQRQVVLMIGLEGMRYEETAKRLDIPLGTVRSRLSRGRAALRRDVDGLPPGNSNGREYTDKGRRISNGLKLAKARRNGHINGT